MARVWLWHVTSNQPWICVNVVRHDDISRWRTWTKRPKMGESGTLRHTRVVGRLGWAAQRGSPGCSKARWWCGQRGLCVALGASGAAVTVSGLFRHRKRHFLVWPPTSSFYTRHARIPHTPSISGVESASYRVHCILSSRPFTTSSSVSAPLWSRTASIVSGSGTRSSVNTPSHRS